MIATRVGDRRHVVDDLLAWDGSVEESRDHPCAGTAESVVLRRLAPRAGPLVPTDEPERHRHQRPSSCRQLGGRPGSSSAQWRLSRATASTGALEKTATCATRRARAGRSGFGSFWARPWLPCGGCPPGRLDIPRACIPVASCWE